MSAMSESDPVNEASESGPTRFACDFCGKSVPRVRRIALDRDYDRLQKPHHVRFACDACSHQKERLRLARDPG
jgi:hypothetical protein